MAGPGPRGREHRGDGDGDGDGMGSGTGSAMGTGAGAGKARSALAAVLARPGPHPAPGAASSRRRTCREPLSCTTPSATARSPCQVREARERPRRDGAVPVPHGAARAPLTAGPELPAHPSQHGTSTPRRRSPSASSCPAWRSCWPGSPTATMSSMCQPCLWPSGSPRCTAGGPGRWCATTCRAATWRTGRC